MAKITYRNYHTFDLGFRFPFFEDPTASEMYQITLEARKSSK